MKAACMKVLTPVGLEVVKQSLDFCTNPSGKIMLLESEWYTPYHSHGIPYCAVHIALKECINESIKKPASCSPQLTQPNCKRTTIVCLIYMAFRSVLGWWLLLWCCLTLMLVSNFAWDQTFLSPRFFTNQETKLVALPQPPSWQRHHSTAEISLNVALTHAVLRNQAM